MTTTTERREVSRDGFDLVMTRERDGWTCSLYRAGGQVPLARGLVAGDVEARRWFDGQMPRFAPPPAARSPEQLREEERAAHAEYEERTVATRVGGRDVTIAELRVVFEAVLDRADWKAPWAAAVPHRLVPLVTEAVKFFHADLPRTVGIELLTGRVLMEGNGYQA
jgi:hypothetical protein